MSERVQSEQVRSEQVQPELVLSELATQSERSFDSVKREGAAPHPVLAYRSDLAGSSCTIYRRRK